MSTADDAWQGYAQSTLLGWTAGENTRIKDGFMAGYRRALEDAAVKVDSMRQINPMNGDGSNYTLDRALAIFDRLAESDAPSRAAEDAWDKRMDEYEAEYYNGDGKQRRERRARNRAAGVGIDKQDACLSDGELASNSPTKDGDDEAPHVHQWRTFRPYNQPAYQSCAGCGNVIPAPKDDR